MVEAQSDFAEILARYQKLNKADRKAVLASFSAEDRVLFTRAMAAEEEAQAAEELRQRQADRQFLGYSPAIARIAEDAVKGNDIPLAPKAIDAIVTTHEELKDRQDTVERGGLLGAIDRILNQFVPDSRRAQ